MSRDIFHQTRWLRAPSNPALNPAREGGGSYSFSGHPVPDLVEKTLGVTEQGFWGTYGPFGDLSLWYKPRGGCVLPHPQVPWPCNPPASRIIESFRVEKTPEIIKSNCKSSAAKSTPKPCP